MHVIARAAITVVSDDIAHVFVSTGRPPGARSPGARSPIVRDGRGRAGGKQRQDDCERQEGGDVDAKVLGDHLHPHEAEDGGDRVAQV